MVFFSVEIVLASYAKAGYLNSFFFWLDLLSTLSMLTDVGWLWFWMYTGTAGNYDTPYDIAKTGRAGRVIRIVRIVRLIRLIRIVKLYKQAQMARKKAEELASQDTFKNLQKKYSRLGGSMKDEEKPKKKKKKSHKKKDDDYDKNKKIEEGEFVDSISEESSESEEEEEAEEEVHIQEESKISKILSDKTIKTVSILVLFMLFSTQLMQTDTYQSYVSLHEHGVAQMVKFYDKGDSASFELAYKHMILLTRTGIGEDYPLVFFESVKATDDDIDEVYIKK